MRGYTWGVAIASMMGLIGCGEDDTYVYDVSLDEAALSNVPIECWKQAVPEERTVEGLEAQQRWRFQRGEMDSLSLEIPQVGITAPGIGEYFIGARDGAPDVLHGSAAADGGFQFLHFKELGFGRLAPASQAFSIVVETKTLDDTIQGFMWLRFMSGLDRGVLDRWSVPQCAITIPFTGKRVKE